MNRIDTEGEGAIVQIIDTDEYEVEEVLENCLEFLQQQQIAPKIHYSLYKSNFRDWLGIQAFKTFQKTFLTFSINR